MRRSEEVETAARDDLHDVVGREFGGYPERLAMSSNSTAILVRDGEHAPVGRAARKTSSISYVLTRRHRPPLTAQ